jgi:hypothetical protein
MPRPRESTLIKHRPLHRKNPSVWTRVCGTYAR